jgi:hypothetical protein
MRLQIAGYGILLLLVLLLGFLVHSATAEGPTQQINWTVETILDGIDINEGNPSITADEEGGVHICYHDANASALIYAYRTIDGDWSIEVLDNSSLVGKHNSMTIDSEGLVHVVYLDYQDQDLKYAVRDHNGLWTIDLIDSENITGQYPSLRVDSLDGLHVVYYSKSDQGIKYAHKPKGEGWHISTISSIPGFVCIGMDLQIDRDDTLHLAYVKQLSGEWGTLFYSSKPADQPWDFKWIVIDNGVRSHISLAVDQKSNLQIVYTLHHGGAVQANKYGDNDWYTYALGLMENLSEDVSNGITSRGQHYICGRQYPPRGFGCYYETKIGSVRIGIVDPNLQGDLYTSLIIDENDHVHIAYSDIGNNRLMYATDRYRPPPPENISIVVGDTFVILKWDPPSRWESIPNLSYNVYRRGPRTYMVPPLFKSGISNTNLFDEDVRRRNTYTYRLATVSDAGEGHLSVPIEAVPTRYPTTPTDVSPVSGDGYVNLNWRPPQDNQSHIITGYRIYWQNKHIFWNRILIRPGVNWNNITLEGNSLFFNHTGLMNGHTYFYEICALREGGEGERSFFKWAMPLRPPSEPFNLTQQVEDLNITVRWNRPFDDGGYSILKYMIYRGTSVDDLKLFHTYEGHSPDWSLYWEPQTFYQNIRLSENDEFMNLSNPFDFYLYYQVQAVNGAGEGPLSEIIQVPLPILPEPPFDIKAKGNSSGIQLTWSEPRTHTALPITGYIIQRSSLLGNWTTIEVISEEQLSFFDPEVEIGFNYDYRISAMNDAGEGEPSNFVSGEIQVPVEQVPFYTDWNFNLIGAVIAMGLILLGAIWYRFNKRKQFDEEFTRWQEGNN